MTDRLDGSDSSSELDGRDGAELAADFVAALVDSSSSDDEGLPIPAADAASGTASIKYRDPHRQFQLEGLPLGLQLEQRYLSVAETGGAIYDAGVVLSRWLCSHPNVVRGLSVLELGCGTGLTALTAAALGAREVIATDMDESALRLAQDNFEAHATWLEQCPHRVCSPDLSRYRWGSALPPTLQSWQDRAAAHSDGSVVLAADVLYDNDETFGSLLSTLSFLLPQSPVGAADGGSARSSLVLSERTKCGLEQHTCFLCFPRRRVHTEQAYITALKAVFCVEYMDITGPVSSGCDREMVLLCLRPLPQGSILVLGNAGPK
eukprot:COSAG02_NODE_4158_length_5692_cov_2.326541_1_plen_320_part_00